MHYAGTRHPLAQHNPLRSIPLFQPLGILTLAQRRSLPQHVQDAAELHARRYRAGKALAAATADVTRYEAMDVHARRLIGQANRGLMEGYPVHGAEARRELKRDAFQNFNQVRARLRRARKAMAAAQIELAAIAAAGQA